MIDRETFYARLEQSCKPCEFWDGVCLKGHHTSSPTGCPVHKFEPILSSSYDEDRPVSKPQFDGLKCCGHSEILPPLTWPEVAASLIKSVTEWSAKGFPVVDSAKHSDRYQACKGCENFEKFYCKHCKCVAYLKSKLETEECPFGKW